MNRLTALSAALLLATGTALADPCGMVPPAFLGAGPPIERIDVQKTYVFYKNGIESFAIRPGFRGKVEHFGMLIPFPTPPAIRKLPDDFFAHVAAAIDPPEVVVDLRPMEEMALRKGVQSAVAYAAKDGLAINQVRVLREEAVGMYQVAVLEAGSAGALKGWMDQHGYRYPEGMDVPVGDYVAMKWCFVAVRTKVAPKSAVDPRPGMESPNPGLPDAASFDGHVQAMGFRFRTPHLVVPMRLSAFNLGDLHNIVYVLAEGPRKIAGFDEAMVRRQLDGVALRKNLTEPLPLRVLGGTIDDIPASRLAAIATQRDPTPKNGLAKQIFASDLLAARHDRLAHPAEELEKELLRIGERLDLRGPELDSLHYEELLSAQRAELNGVLNDLDTMTISVIDGEFERELLRKDNVAFEAFSMPGYINVATQYDAVAQGPRALGAGRLYREMVQTKDQRRILIAVLIVLAGGAYLLLRRAAAASKAMDA